MRRMWKSGLVLLLVVFILSTLVNSEDAEAQANNPPVLVYARSVDEPQGLHVPRTVVAVWSDGLCYRRVRAGDPIVGYLDDALMDHVTREILKLGDAMVKEECRTIGMPGEAMQRMSIRGTTGEASVAWNTRVAPLFEGGGCGDAASNVRFLSNWMRGLNLETDCVSHAPLDKDAGARLLLGRRHGVSLD